MESTPVADMSTAYERVLLVVMSRQRAYHETCLWLRTREPRRERGAGTHLWSGL